ncbi:MAG TPA: MSMEG_1061 family FMN-dependent PPOX-type flavoprotein [Acidimicrobiales bacterium]|nr:MSMEG_1061 family FMN-dependent PPOX-type flavoprotein [Acidimicrobiales bacterium]
MATPFASTITTDAELRALYREPSPRVQAKKVNRIDATTRAFIEGSPFCLVATAGADGHCDVSPRGGPPGFVKVLDEGRLAIPDLSGNNLLDSLSNIVANPQAGLLLVIPGRDETLRVEGEAHLTTDPAVLELWDDELRRPKVAIGLAVRTVYIHCAKSFRRGRVWDPASWTELTAPDTCEVFVDQLGLDLDPAQVRSSLEQSYERDLAAERPGR